MSCVFLCLFFLSVRITYEEFVSYFQAITIRIQNCINFKLHNYLYIFIAFYDFLQNLNF